MCRYYPGLPLAKLKRRTGLHPLFDTNYNALQCVAYFPVPVAGLLSVSTGSAIHQPIQLYWLIAIFGGYDKARVWQFWLQRSRVRVSLSPHFFRARAKNGQCPSSSNATLAGNATHEEITGESEKRQFLHDEESKEWLDKNYPALPSSMKQVSN
jgi:hypothetical protein